MAASGEFPAPVAVTETVQTNNAMGFGFGFVVIVGDPKVGKLPDVTWRDPIGGRSEMGGGGGAGAKAVEDAADEAEVDEDEGGESEEEEEEGGEKGHDDGFQEKGEKLRAWFWLGVMMVRDYYRRRHDGDELDLGTEEEDEDEELDGWV